MKNTLENRWIYNLDGSEFWDCSDKFVSKEDCIKAGIDEALEQGIANFEIGRTVSVGRLQIDAEFIIDNFKEDLYERIGEASEGFLYALSDNEIEELDKMLNEAYGKWLDKHKKDGGEGYFEIEDVEEITYCAYCKKVISDEEECSELIKVPESVEGDYERECCFHTSCDYIPCIDLLGGQCGLKTEKRNCTNCNREMTEGYVIDDGMQYYCSDECLHEEFTEKEYKELYEQGQAYWTEFE